MLEKIDYRFLLRLGGSFTTGASQTGQNYYNNISGEYHLATLTVTGRSFRGDEIRGSGVLYTYDYD